MAKGEGLLWLLPLALGLRALLSLALGEGLLLPLCLDRDGERRGCLSVRLTGDKEEEGECGERLPGEDKEAEVLELCRRPLGWACWCRAFLAGGDRDRDLKQCCAGVTGCIIDTLERQRMYTSG